MSYDAGRNVTAARSLAHVARYFFHTTNGAPTRDAEGLELATTHRAELEAVRFLGDLLSEQPEALWPSRSLTITVTDVGGRVAFTVQARVMPG